MPKVLKDMNIEQRMKNWQVVEKWAEIVGARISQHAQATAVDTEILYVEVDTPMWQSQLFLMKGSIIRKIKKYSTNIKDIKFRVVDEIGGH
jgi:predicted nucleic acid-binding Zn ribbon protein